MTALNFPASPSDGDTYSAAGRTWKWSASTSSWNVQGIELDLATAAQFLADTSGKVLSTDPVWTAAEKVALTDASTIAVDFSTFINATVTLAGNRTLGNPSNAKEGQTGAIEIKQDATGSRTLAFGSYWKFAISTAPTLSTAANARDVLFYQVLSSTEVLGILTKAVA